jgi:hypothetical protein
MKSIFIFFTLLVCTNVFSQTKRDQDLVTLKNGNQFLGYIIEQKPGKTIKLYRPTVNDTVTVQMAEIDKLTKIFVESFADKKIETTDTIIETGRFNNKKNVYQISYAAHFCEGYGNNFVTGFSAAWYHSFNNKYFAGFSATIFQNQANTLDIYDRTAEAVITLDKTINQAQFMFENKFRLSRKPQNKRITTLFGVNVGYVLDNSRTDYPSRSVQNIYDVNYETSKGSFMFQTNLQFKVNPDNNSGFAVEPGYAYYAPIIRQYASNVTDASGEPLGIYLGYRLEKCHIFTLKIGYFF